MIFTSMTLYNTRFHDRLHGQGSTAVSIGPRFHGCIGTCIVKVPCGIMSALGFPVSVSRAAFGRGSGLIFLDNVQCTGREDELLECPSQDPGSHNCGSSEDAGVYCPCE